MLPSRFRFPVRPPLTQRTSLTQDPAELNILKPSPSEPDEHDYKHYHGKRDY